MIDGAGQFHYIGLIRRGGGVMMVFREGVLVLDTGRPGGGVMAPSDLLRLLPDAGSPRPSPRPDGASDDEDVEVTNEEIRYFEQLSASVTTSSDSSSDEEPVPDPVPIGAPVEGPWSPPMTWLGWFPSEAPVQASPVTRQGLEAYRSADDQAGLEALRAALLAGIYAPRPPASPGAGMMACLLSFGEPVLLAWNGEWSAAGDAGHVRIGLTGAVANSLVAHAHVAHHCNLAPLRVADRSTFLALVQDAQTRALVFDTGLLVQQHPDARLVGWHRYGGNNHWDLVQPIQVRRLRTFSALDDAHTYPLFGEFMSGLLHWSENCHFAAILWSSDLNRWLTLDVALPQGLLAASGSPDAPSKSDARQALKDAALAPMHDRQRINGPFSLGSGRWNVPVLLGALRCLMTADAVPELVHDTWHATLQPASERLLLAHRAHEKDWLAQGAICQSIDGLVGIMQRDRRMRRPEVWVMWPVALLEELFQTLAPHTPVRVNTHPVADSLDEALSVGHHHLVVFQRVGTPEQSVAVVMGPQCWTDQTWSAVDTVVERARRSFAPDATEHVVAIVSLK